MKVGDAVRVKPSVQRPKYAWGPHVSHLSVGVVADVREDYLKVDFPSHKGWNADAQDLEVLVTSSPKVSGEVVRKPPRKSPEKVLAYGIIDKDGSLYTSVDDRDLARYIKAELGGKQNGITIVTLKADKEIR